MPRGRALQNFIDLLEAEATQNRRPKRIEINEQPEFFLRSRKQLGFQGSDPYIYYPYIWKDDREVVVIHKGHWDPIENELRTIAENFRHYAYDEAEDRVTNVFGIPVTLYTPDTIIRGEE